MKKRKETNLKFDLNNQKHQEVLEILKFNQDISIIKIEEFLEYLEDNLMLSKKGKSIRNLMWELFIKE